MIDFVIKESLHRETGARGIESSLSRYMEDATFDAFSAEEAGRLELKIRDGEVVYELS